MEKKEWRFSYKLWKIIALKPSIKILLYDFAVHD